MNHHPAPMKLWRNSIEIHNQCFFKNVVFFLCVFFFCLFAGKHPTSVFLSAAVSTVDVIPETQ